MATDGSSKSRFAAVLHPDFNKAGAGTGSSTPPPRTSAPPTRPPSDDEVTTVRPEEDAPTVVRVGSDRPGAGTGKPDAPVASAEESPATPPVTPPAEEPAPAGATEGVSAPPTAVSPNLQPGAEIVIRSSTPPPSNPGWIEGDKGRHEASTARQTPQSQRPPAKDTIASGTGTVPMPYGTYSILQLAVMYNDAVTRRQEPGKYLREQLQKICKTHVWGSSYVLVPVGECDFAVFPSGILFSSLTKTDKTLSVWDEERSDYTIGDYRMERPAVIKLSSNSLDILERLLREGPLTTAKLYTLTEKGRMVLSAETRQGRFASFFQEPDKSKAAPHHPAAASAMKEQEEEMMKGDGTPTVPDMHQRSDYPRRVAMALLWIVVGICIGYGAFTLRASPQKTTEDNSPPEPAPTPTETATATKKLSFDCDKVRTGDPITKEFISQCLGNNSPITEYDDRKDDKDMVKQRCGDCAFTCPDLEAAKHKAGHRAHFYDLTGCTVVRTDATKKP